jgi:TonB-dependent receptor-like protein
MTSRRALILFRKGLAFALTLVTQTVAGQTTQGLVAGGVHDESGEAVCARVCALRASVDSGHSYSQSCAETDVAGRYTLPSLSPGTYRFRADAIEPEESSACGGTGGFQARELHELTIHVASRLEVNFVMRPLDAVWGASYFQAGRYTIVNYFATDTTQMRSADIKLDPAQTGTLHATVSYVVDSKAIENLPLNGRDVYTALVMLPGVTADIATARGLGLSINGQRPNASNFLLDGLEHNNYLLTGPLALVAPEAIQEYRISTNNFSAEYGRTAGFVANAITRSGGTDWHGMGYYYMRHEVLNANGFQQNAKGIPRRPMWEQQPGFNVSGPLVGNLLFGSGSFEYLRSTATGDPAPFRLPTDRFVAEETAPGSLSRGLLEAYPPPVVHDANASTKVVSLAPTSSIHRYLAVPRVDLIAPNGEERLMFRVALSRASQPDFVWTPYPDFRTELNQSATGLAATWIRTPRPGMTNEFRFGLSTDVLDFERPEHHIPTLEVSDGTVLPGSPAFYGFSNRGHGVELSDNLVWTEGRHVIKIGGGVLLRNLDGSLTAGRDSYFGFKNYEDFAGDSPFLFYTSLARAKLPEFVVPQYEREYRYRQFSLFAQDSFRAHPRLAFNYGIRYEHFGAPSNTGPVKDLTVQLGPGANFPDRISAASLDLPSGGDQRMFDADNNDLAVRFGFSYSLQSDAVTLLKGAYGIFYDRPFDNLWLNLRSNNLVIAPFLRNPPTPLNYLAPVQSILKEFEGHDFSKTLPQPTLYQPGIRNPYVHSYFLNVERKLSDTLVIEVGGLGSLGRKLITTDSINREDSVPRVEENYFRGRLNPDLPPISYRANQGASSYHALTATARYRTTLVQLQAAYTWSHSIDNQSDPLQGDLLDLRHLRRSGEGSGTAQATFSRQFDSQGDRGNSDFDQRHNLVIYSIWEVPYYTDTLVGKLLQHWRFSQLAAIRSGFPYSVTDRSRSGAGIEQIFNNRVDIVNSDPGWIYASEPVDGGRRLLNRWPLKAPARGTLGNSGRNAFRGPGMFSVDLSIGRSFPFRPIGEAGRINVRLDAFNVLNHANLNNPRAQFEKDETFGTALYGREGMRSAFPAVVPLDETPRQLQLMLQVEF